jgi:hypothetical protein
MEVIPAPLVIEQGIAIFVPTKPQQVGFNMSVRVEHSLSTGTLNSMLIDCSPTCLWQAQAILVPPYTLFLYERPLNYGYYTISLVATKGSQTLKGNRTIGVTVDQQYLVIGSPYSIHPAIPLE